MSEKNGKVCCNCRHNKREPMKDYVECYCDIDGSWLSYITVMTHCCKHWSREKGESEVEDGNDN
jgi:hypothetical protein